jgi:hypothetical protein
MAAETAMVTDSNDYNINADANDSALCYVNTINTPLIKLTTK